MNLSISSIFKIIGIVLMVVGFSMLPSVIVSFIYDDSSVYIPFLITMLASGLTGIALMLL